MCQSIMFPITLDLYKVGDDRMGLCTNKKQCKKDNTHEKIMTSHGVL